MKNGIRITLIIMLLGHIVGTALNKDDGGHSSPRGIPTIGLSPFIFRLGYLASPSVREVNLHQLHAALSDGALLPTALDGAKTVRSLYENDPTSMLSILSPYLARIVLPWHPGIGMSRAVGRTIINSSKNEKPKEPHQRIPIMQTKASIELYCWLRFIFPQSSLKTPGTLIVFLKKEILNSLLIKNPDVNAPLAIWERSESTKNLNWLWWALHDGLVEKILFAHSFLPLWGEIGLEKLEILHNNPNCLKPTIRQWNEGALPIDSQKPCLVLIESSYFDEKPDNEISDEVKRVIDIIMKTQIKNLIINISKSNTTHQYVFDEVIRLLREYLTNYKKHNIGTALFLEKGEYSEWLKTAKTLSPLSPAEIGSFSQIAHKTGPLHFDGTRFEQTVQSLASKLSFNFPTIWDAVYLTPEQIKLINDLMPAAIESLTYRGEEITHTNIRRELESLCRFRLPSDKSFENLLRKGTIIIPRYKPKKLPAPKKKNSRSTRISQ